MVGQHLCKKYLYDCITVCQGHISAAYRLLQVSPQAVSIWEFYHCSNREPVSVQVSGTMLSFGLVKLYLKNVCVCVFSLSSTCLVNVNNSRSNFNWLIPSRSGALSTFGLQNTTGSKVTKMLLKYIVITLIFPTLKIDLTIFFTFFYQYWVSPLVPIIIF